MGQENRNAVAAPPGTRTKTAMAEISGEQPKIHLEDLPADEPILSCVTFDATLIQRVGLDAGAAAARRSPSAADRAAASSLEISLAQFAIQGIKGCDEREVPMRRRRLAAG